MSLLLHALPVIAINQFIDSQPYSGKQLYKPVSIYIAAKAPAKPEPVQEEIIKKIIPPPPPEPVVQVANIQPDVIPPPSVEPVVEKESPVFEESSIAVSRSETNYIITLSGLLHRAISRKKTYPYMARRRSFQGSTIVEFKLHPEGEITEIELHQTSGYTLLDNAALKAVKAINPFVIADSYIDHPELFRVKIIFTIDESS